MNLLESGATACDSHVTESLPDSERYPKYYETRVISWESRGDHSPRLNTLWRPIVNKYREGKVRKAPPARGVK